MAESGPALSLRAFVDDLASLGWLRDVDKPVDKAWEIACIARWAAESTGEHDAYAIRFRQVIGHEIPVVLGLFGSRRHIARSLGVAPAEIWQCWARALEHPIPPVHVDHGSVQEVVVSGDDIDLTSWPIPTWTPGRDRAPYLSTACVVTADRGDGIQNVGTYRVEVQGPRRLGLSFGSEQQHGAMHRKTWEDAGEPTPVALVLGAAPAVSYAAAAKLRYGVDELTVAGGLVGQAIAVTDCGSHQLTVPADAEMVIEGFMRAGERAPEGPFGECLGYMEGVGSASVIDVQRVTHRHAPIFHGLIQQLPPSEGHVLMELGLLGSLWHHLTGPMRIDGLRDMGVVSGAAGVSVIAIAMRAGDRRSVASVLRAMQMLNWGQKLVVVVDEDIDVHDPESVLWALSSRVNFGTDASVQDDVPIFQMDPAAYQRAGGIGDGGRPRLIPADKMLIDATIKSACTTVSLPSPASMERVRAAWSETGLPPLAGTGRLQRVLRWHSADGVAHHYPGTAPSD